MAEILDSGTRREFDTGAVRDMSEGKGNFSLLPWEVIWDLAKHYEKGNKKYPPGEDGIANWKKGIPVDSYFDSAMRHLVKHKLGWTDEDHAVSALWNICGLIWEERYSPRAYKTDIAAESSTQFNVHTAMRYNFEEVDEAGAKFKAALEDALGGKKSSGIKCEVCGKPITSGYRLMDNGKSKIVCKGCFNAKE